MPCLSAEGRRAGQALAHHAAERVDVRGGRDLLAADLLGRHVVERAERLSGLREDARLWSLASPKSVM